MTRQVYAGFGDVCFITAGEFAYLGAGVSLPGYLASINRAVPSHANPADFMLDLINTDFTSPAGVEAVVEEVASRE